MVERQRIRSVARAVKWQIGKRLGATRALVTVGPARFYCYPGNLAASGCLYTGFMEFDEMAFTVRYLRPGDHFVDIGANIGTFSVFAGTFVPGTHITSVEPDEPTRLRLVENLRLNSLPTTDVIEKATAETPGTARFSTGRDTLNSLTDDGVESIEVETTTLDLITMDDTPALIKVDVEGAELNVFKGAGSVLSATPAPVLLFEMNGLCRKFGHEPDEIFEHLRSRGYVLHEYNGNTNVLTEFNGTDLPVTKNLVATKDVRAVRDRLTQQWSSDDLKAVPVVASLERN